MEIKQRIKSVRQLRPIQVSEGSFTYPHNMQTKIKLDKKSPVHRKEHQLIYQQGMYYGSVGDCCTYLSNEQLLELETRGLIHITRQIIHSKKGVQP